MSLLIDQFDGAPYRMNGYMAGQWFEQILAALRFTTKEKPNHVDRFWQVQDMITAWKDNMFASFTLGWSSCIDEPMTTWINKYT